MRAEEDAYGPAQVRQSVDVFLHETWSRGTSRTSAVATPWCDVPGPCTPAANPWLLPGFTPPDWTSGWTLCSSSKVSSERSRKPPVAPSSNDVVVGTFAPPASFLAEVVVTVVHDAPSVPARPLERLWREAEKRYLRPCPGAPVASPSCCPKDGRGGRPERHRRSLPWSMAKADAGARTRERSGMLAR